jgi:hypothetical protein
MRYAIVQGGRVVNVIAWDGVAPWQAPAGATVVPANDDAEIGGTFAAGRFTRPVLEELPAPVTLDQLAAVVAKIARGEAVTAGELDAIDADAKV